MQDHTTRKRRRRFRRAILLMSASAVIAASAGLAFYVATGSGSKDTSFTTKGAPANVPVLVIVNGSTSGAITSPVGPGESATFDVQINNRSVNAAYVSKVGLDPALGDNGISGLPVGCLRAWFTLPDVTVNETVAGGDTWSATQVGTLTFLDSGTNQNACQSITPVVQDRKSVV